MIRTAFSTTVREAGDLSAGIFDLQGRMLAQAVTGTPGHVNSMMESVGHFLANPGQHDAAGRPLHHQRPLARHRPPARPDGGHSGFPERPDRRPLRQYRPYHRHRRPRHGS
ncbi:hydantoinase B/oxoprolinase family protein [Paeniroseomonas aquatica]|uniref:hydantoinase B/oxoprolinase family protein n=1 Tax=Paeniroseomonas aquatica TaxID=373043 RepID=UPI00361B796B